MRRIPCLSLLCTLIAALIGVPAGASILHVEANGSGQYATIQAAMNAAAPGDTVELGDGLYSGPGNRAIVFEWVLLRSASGDPLACRIDGDGTALGSLSGTGFLTFERIGILDCTRLTGSIVGQVLFAGCRITDCVGITSLNSPLESSTVQLVDCLVANCYTTLLGADEVVIDLCRFENNHDTISGSGQMRCRDSEFVGNMGETLMAHYWFIAGAQALYERCLFLNNDTQDLFGLGEVHAVFRQCRFAGNAGAVIKQDWWGGMLHLEMENCSLAGNAAGAPASIWIGDETWGEISITRSILAWEAGAQLFALGTNAPVPTLTHCDLFGNAGGDWVGPIADQLGVGCNMSADPLYCDWPSGDLTLHEDSPCLPANNACGVQIGALGQGCGDPTAAEPAPGGELRLAAQPNPFNPKTRIVFTLPQAARVDLTVFDTAGRRVAVLLEGAPRPAGAQSVDWDARGLSSGVYLARLEAAGQQQEIKLTLLR